MNRVVFDFGSRPPATSACLERYAAVLTEFGVVLRALRMA